MTRLSDMRAALLACAMALLGCGQYQREGRPLDAGAKAWSALAPLADGPRQETAVVALNDRIYVLGGFIDSQTIVSRVEAYDPKSDTWADSAPLPRPLHHPNAAVVEDRLYVVGALVGTQFAALGDVYRYDPGTNAWTQLTSMPPGTQRGAGAAAVIGTKIYVAGGYRQGSVADFSAYDTATDTWEILPSLSELRDHLVGGAVGDKIYAIGGRRNGALRANVDEFDPSSATWTSGTPMLTARAGCAAAVISERIYVAGGEGNRSVQSGVFPQNEVYDPARDRWDSLQPMLTPRHGTGGAALNGLLYVPGGATQQGFGAADNNEAYTP